MIRHAIVSAALSAIAINLAGCDRQAPVAAPTAEATSEAVLDPGPAPSPSATPTAEVNEPAVPNASRDPQEVLGAWAKAVELRDWRTVRSYWGDHGKTSGMDDAAFAAKWSDLIAPKVTVGAGQQEGAAGSLYYTAPVTILDGSRTVKGEVTMRRVNDVPGATPEQLRWHIESTTLKW
jgi:hypothetical protein